MVAGHKDPSIEAVKKKKKKVPCSPGFSKKRNSILLKHLKYIKYVYLPNIIAFLLCLNKYLIL
jgi:hypothetical protein